MENNKPDSPQEPPQHFWDNLYLVVLVIIVLACCYALISSLK